MSDTLTLICEEMAKGRSLRQICMDEGMPAESTVRFWAVEDKPPGFAARYARAREAQMEALSEDLLAISDDKTGDPVRDRLRIDARKWLMSKIAPKKYGDRIEVEQTVEHRFVARIPEPAANASEWLADQKPKQIEGTAVSTPHGEMGEKISKPR